MEEDMIHLPRSIEPVGRMEKQLETATVRSSFFISTSVQSRTRTFKFIECTAFNSDKSVDERAN
jgi:hypothetical protein